MLITMKPLTKRQRTARINKALKRLGQQGYTVARGLGDCRTCAWANLSDDEAQRAVFTTDQSEDDYQKYGEMYFDWCGEGKDIADAFRLEGLAVNWNGDKGMRIIVR